MRDCDIICIGEPLVEFNQISGSDWRQGFGGDVSNVAIAAARLGAASAIATRLGDDGFGAELRALWEHEGVDASCVVTDATAPTGLYFVRHDADGHGFEYRRAGSAASLLTADALPIEGIKGAQFTHVSGITLAISANAREAGLESMRMARAAGRRASFDPNLRLALWSLEDARRVIRQALGLADVALPGLDDARQLTGLDAPEEIVRAFHDMGPDIVALTLGEEGALLGHAGTITHVPGVPVAAVDATGAGDCFDGAFLSRLTAGDTPEAACRYAVVASALSVAGYGAVAPLPTAAEVAAAVSE
ncbi:sugar kinase [Sulfitobacter sp. W074]|uniref:sugar kinase n=1 Tax=Sulfitobacter sp. W074 TaxID=2867026 RepID=UPI0021A6677E|nr:sugar kinase [Sulfitobacter sp. W074]UWR38402.1 sugar kinase [Sulfitobacter sp. W074]